MTEPSPNRAVRVVAAYEHLLMVVSRLGPTARVVWEGPEQYRADRLALDEVREAYQRVCEHPRFGPTPAPLVEYITREGHLVLMCLGKVVVDPPNPRAECASIAQAQAEREAKLQEERDREARAHEELLRICEEENLVEQKYFEARRAVEILSFGGEGWTVTVSRSQQDSGVWEYHVSFADTTFTSLEEALQAFGRQFGGQEDEWMYRTYWVRPDFRDIVWELAQAAAADRPANLTNLWRLCHPEE